MSLLLMITMFAGCKKEDKEVGNGEDTQKGTETEKQDDTEKEDDDDKKEDESKDDESTALVSEEKITLTVMSRRDPMGGDWKDLRIFKDLEEMTNVHFEFDVVYEGFDEKKNLALATGDMPDIFLGALGVEDEETYGPQGVLIDLTDLIEEHGTNMKQTFEKYPLLKQTMTASDGNIYALGQVLKTPTMGSYKPVINKVWLDNLGLEVPETIDDLYEVLKAFKTDDPNKNGENDEIPLGEIQFTHLNGMLLPAFGEMAQDIAVWDGEIVYTPMTEGYKHYLEFVNKLYKEELIDPMFISHSMDEYMAKTKENIYGVLGSVRQADWEQYQIMHPFTSEYNSEKFSSSSDTVYAASRFAITNVNEHPVESIKWADLFFTEIDKGYEGITGAAMWIGRRGTDWDFTADGSAIEYLFEPDEGLTEIQTLLKKVTPSQTGFVGELVMDAPFESPYLKWVGENNVTHVFPHIKPERIFPSGARFTQEEQERISILGTDIGKYMEESRAKFATGELSFDKWDDYVKTLEDMDIDEYIKIHQDAYDRFMASGE